MISQSDYSVNYIDEYGQQTTEIFDTQEEAEAFINGTPNWLECNFIPSFADNKWGITNNGNV